MDKLKDASLQLGIVNLVGMIGTSTYFYKRMEAQQAELTKVTTAIGNILTRMAEWEKDEPNRREVIRGMREELRRLEVTINDGPKNNPFDIDELVNALEENGMVIGSNPATPIRKVLSQGLPHEPVRPAEESKRKISRTRTMPEPEENSHLINLVRATGNQ